jgi:hypothetical protein
MPSEFTMPRDYWLTLRDPKAPRIFYTLHHV